MSKKVETKTTIEDSFEGFKLLDQNAAPVKDDDLSQEELDAIENAANANSGKSKGEDKTKDISKQSQEADESEEKETEDKKDSEIRKTEKDENGSDDLENPYAAYAKYMADRNLLDLEEEDKIESEEDLEKVQEKTINKRVTQWKEKLPEDAQKFLDFVEDGGNPSDFHKYYYNDASFETFDISEEENQKYVVKEALKLEGYSDEEIEDEINDKIDLGKLEKTASIHLKKLQKLEKEQKEHLVTAQKQYAKEQETKRQKDWEDFKKGLFDKEQIGGFKITPKSKNDLWEYMTKVTDKKQGLTQYQIDSNSNEDARYVFAYLLKNKWDVKSLERMVETKKVGELRGKLSNFTDTRNKISKTAKTDYERQLEDNPFAGFKKLQ